MTDPQLGYPQESITEGYLSYINWWGAKKRSTRLRSTRVLFRENISEEQKKCLQAYIFDNGVTLPIEGSHITPRG